MGRPTTANLGLQKSFLDSPENVCGVREDWGPVMDGNLDAIDSAVAGVGVTTISAVISADQLSALHAHPVQLVAAPGAGLALVPLAMTLQYVFNANAYGTVHTGDLSLGWKGSSAFTA